MNSFEKLQEVSSSSHKQPASFKHKVFNRSNRHIIVLLAAFAGVLSIVALVTWYGLFNFNSVQVKLILTQRMAETARQRILTMHKMTELADPFDRDAEALKLNSLASQFAEARIKLVQLGLQSNEQALLDEQGKRTAVAVPVQLEIVDLLANDQLQVARNMLIFEASPAQDKVMEVLEDISQSQIVAANRASIEARNIYQTP